MGNTHTTVSLLPSSSPLFAATILSMTDWWEMITPFDFPVVPEVKRMNAGSCTKGAKATDS